MDGNRFPLSISRSVGARGSGVGESQYLVRVRQHSTGESKCWSHWEHDLCRGKGALEPGKSCSAVATMAQPDTLNSGQGITACL